MWNSFWYPWTRKTIPTTMRRMVNPQACVDPDAMYGLSAAVPQEAISRQPATVFDNPSADFVWSASLAEC
jgi:hypothetical protein